jgi:hypothetical protein
MYIYIYIHIYIHTYTYTHRHPHTYIHTHIYTHHTHTPTTHTRNMAPRMADCSWVPGTQEQSAILGQNGRALVCYLQHFREKWMCGLGALGHRASSATFPGNAVNSTQVLGHSAPEWPSQLTSMGGKLGRQSAGHVGVVGCMCLGVWCLGVGHTPRQSAILPQNGRGLFQLNHRQRAAGSIPKSPTNAFYIHGACSHV